MMEKDNPSTQAAKEIWINIEIRKSNARQVNAAHPLVPLEILGKAQSIQSRTRVVRIILCEKIHPTPKIINFSIRNVDSEIVIS